MARPVPLRRRLGSRLNLKKTLFLLPNLITMSSIYCGVWSIHVSAAAETSADYLRAAVLIVFAMVFDMLDGRVARMTKTQSAFGLQIDSLADVVSFGVAPALLMHRWVLSELGLVGQIAAFAFVACGAIRLARFNLLSMGEDGRPTKPPKYIVGLPIPGAAGVLVALVIAHSIAADATVPTTSTTHYGVSLHHGMLALTLLLSFLMVSNVKFRSFKELRVNAPTLAVVAFAIASSAVVSTRLGPAFVLAWLLGVYVTFGILETLAGIPSALRARRGAARPTADSVPPQDR
jgi:CDP-diacylglycerol--serine O-phosphatidyltransferase